MVPTGLGACFLVGIAHGSLGGLPAVYATRVGLPAGWVGLFAAPVLVTLACSGLVILYSQPIDDALNGNLLLVAQGPESVPLDEQVTTAKHQLGADYVLDAVVPPAGPGRSTRVDFRAPDAAEHGESELTQVFVDPYTGNITFIPDPNNPMQGLPLPPGS